MKSKLKKILMLMLVVALCFVSIVSIVGCGGTDYDNIIDGGDDGDIAGDIDPEDDGSDINGGTKKIYITVADRPSSQNGINRWYVARQEAFRKQYGENIELKTIQDPTAGGDDIKGFESVVNTLTPSDAPTLLPVPGNNTARTIAMTGLIQDYTPYVSFYKDYEDINEDALNSLTIDGKLYGMPTSIDVPMLGFSVKVLRQIAVDKYTDKDYPDATERNALRAQFVQDMTDEIMAIKTWEGYKEVAKQLTTTTISGAGVWVSSYHLGFGVWHAANGWGMAEQNADGSIALDFANESALKTFEFFRELKKEGIYTLQPESTLNELFGKIFEDQVASFLFYPSWYASWFSGNGFSSSDIITIPFPQGPTSLANGDDPSNLVFASSYVLSKHATPDEAKAAVKYLQFMYGKDAWEARFNYALQENIVDIMVPTLDSVSMDPVYEILPDSWETALNNGRQNGFYITVNSEAYMTALTTYLPRYVNEAYYPTLEDVAQSLREQQEVAIRENTVVKYVPKN